MNAPIASGQFVKRGDAWLLFRDPAPVELTGTGVVSAVHVCSAGEWLGHPDGPFELTEQTFDDMIANAEAQETPLSVDYEHRTFNDVAPDSRAAGWVQKLEKRGKGDGAELWATVEWTARAAEMIRAGEYRFNSPVFRLNATDKKSGEDIGPRLLQIALTNFPFFDGQTPIKCTEQPLQAAESKTMPTPDEQKKIDEEAEAKKAAEDDGADAYAQAVAQFVEGVAKAAGVDTAAAVEALSALGEEIGAMVRSKLDRDGMPSEEMPMAAKEEKETDVQRAERIEREAIAARVKATEEKLALLASETAADKKAREDKAAADKKAAIEKQADELIAAGRAKDSQREDVIFMLTERPESIDRVFGSQVVPIGKRQAGPEQKTIKASETAADPELLEHERMIVKAMSESTGMKPELAKAWFLKNREQINKGAAKVGLLG